MENDAPIIHTFNTDIKEELKRKDAGLLDVALANTNHIESTDPPNYKAFYTVLILFVTIVVVSVLSWYVYQNYSQKNNSISGKNFNNNTNNMSASSTTQIITGDLLSLMPNSYSSLSPYISFYKVGADSKYIVYKIDNYEGLIATLLNNEEHITVDLSKYFTNKDATKTNIISESYEKFKDRSFNNLDLRLASSTVIIKNEMEVATTTYINVISIKNATITEYIKVKGKTVAIKKATTTNIVNNVPTTTMIKIIKENYTDKALIYGLINREYIIFANNINDWQQGYHNIIK